MVVVVTGRRMKDISSVDAMWQNFTCFFWVAVFIAILFYGLGFIIFKGNDLEIPEFPRILRLKRMLWDRILYRKYRINKAIEKLFWCDCP